MRMAAHSCLMTRKSLGGARTTAAMTELSALAAAEDVSEISEAAADAAASARPTSSNTGEKQPPPCSSCWPLSASV